MKDVINSMQSIKTAHRASITIDYQDYPIREHVGETLADGTVILTCFKKKAY